MKSKEDAHNHSHTILSDYIDDKMRLCLLNLFNTFIERYELFEDQGFFTLSNASTHPINLFYCHLSSNEIHSKLKNTNYWMANQTEADLRDQLFDGD